MNLLKERELNSFLDGVYARHDSKVYKDTEKKISQFLKSLEGLNSELKDCLKVSDLCGLNKDSKRFWKQMQGLVERVVTIFTGLRFLEPYTHRHPRAKVLAKNGHLSQVCLLERIRPHRL